jgi:hypothetical protein
MAWLPLLLVENASQSRQTGAAVESFRNAIVATRPPDARPPDTLPPDTLPPDAAPPDAAPRRVTG